MDTPILPRKRQKGVVYTNIYVLVRTSDNYPFYVGKANVVQRRWQQHRDNARNGRKGKLYTYIRKLWRVGDDFQAVCVQQVPDELWGTYEIETIRYYRELGCDLKNVAPGGISPEPTEESRRKISEALRGRPLSAEHRAKLSAAKKGRAPSNKGKKTGKPSPAKQPEARAKMSAALQGRKFTPEWLKKMSDAKKGKPPHNKGKRGVHGKRIYQIDPTTGEVLNVFDCLALAVEHIGRGSSGSLSECANGKRKTAYGYKWAYSLD